MSAKNEGGFAFPRDSQWNMDNSRRQVGATGMTLRDYFAAKAMAALLSQRACEMGQDEIASVSYRVADAMIAERGAK